MKKIKILFTREKNLPFSLAEKEVNEILQKKQQGKFLDLEKGCIESVFTEKTLWIIVNIESKTSSLDKLQDLGAKAARGAQGVVQKKESAEIEVFFDKSISQKDENFLTKGILLTKQLSDDFKSEKEEKNISFKGLKNKEMEIIVEAIERARDLTAQPSNILTPEIFEQYVLDIAKKDKTLKVTVLKEKDLKKERMNMHIAVNAGAPHEARSIVIEYNPEKSKDAPIALVGKGLIYDSGGYYAKPHPSMNDMHGDMAGAASVVAMMSALSKLGIKKHIVGICPLAENMIDAKAYRNGDILTSRKGKTVEVGHTDAEGRLVLADNLTYIQDTYKPSLTFDFATLTGAAHYSLGEMYTAIFSDSEKLIDSFKKLGEEVNDKVWALPFDEDIKEMVKSKHADLSNTSNVKGMLGASTAAAFLANFVEDTEKWVHFDIAGTAHRSQIAKAYDRKHLLGTGAIVHLMLAYLME